MTSADNTILTDIKVEIAMLKQEVSFINKLFERMEILIQKVDNQYETLVDKTSKIDYNFAGTTDENSLFYLGNSIVVNVPLSFVPVVESYFGRSN